MKPSKKETAEVTAPDSPPETETVTETTEPANEGGSEVEVPADEQAPPVVPAEPEAPTIAPSEPPATAAPVRTVKLGQVEAEARRVTVEQVLQWVGEVGQQRVDYLVNEPSTAIAAKAALENDGRFTPVVFSRGIPEADDAPEPNPSILHGYESLALAKHLGIEEIPVLFVAEADVGFVQSFIAERENVAKAPSLDQQDADILRRIMWEDN